MQRSLSLLLATVLLCAALSGCSGKVPLANLFNKAEFWQRTDIREAAYMGRDKAQDLLHRDIAKCVSDVREQESIASLRNAIPADGRGGRTTPQGQLAGWDTPDHQGYLRGEHQNYHDFETCMIHKGWSRISHVPPDVAAKSRGAYLDYVAPDRKKERAGIPVKPVKSTDKHSYINF